MIEREIETQHIWFQSSSGKDYVSGSSSNRGIDPINSDKSIQVIRDNSLQAHAAKFIYVQEKSLSLQIHKLSLTICIISPLISMPWKWP